jgi:hypothetical protein
MPQKGQQQEQGYLSYQSYRACLDGGFYRLNHLQNRVPTHASIEQWISTDDNVRYSSTRPIGNKPVKPQPYSSLATLLVGPLNNSARSRHRQQTTALHTDLSACQSG